MSIKKLRSFKYLFMQGPLSEELLKQNIDEGNCRLALQDYFFTCHNIYLKPADILLPKAYKHTGFFVKNFSGDLTDFFHDLKRSDIIYAEKLRNKQGEYAYKSQFGFKERDEWILYFHTAIYLGRLDKNVIAFIPDKIDYAMGTPVIWHASFIAGETALWSVEKFCQYYKPVAAKRLSIT